MRAGGTIIIYNNAHHYNVTNTTYVRIQLGVWLQSINVTNTTYIYIYKQVTKLVVDIKVLVYMKSKREEER